MPSGRPDENSAPRNSLHGRKRTLTRKLQDMRNASSANSKARQDQQRKKARRRILRERQNDDNLTVERPDDSNELKELRGASLILILSVFFLHLVRA